MWNVIRPLFYDIKAFDMKIIKEFCPFSDIFFYNVMSTFHGMAHLYVKALIKKQTL